MHVHSRCSHDTTLQDSHVYIYIYIHIIERERETLSATVLDASIYRVFGKVDWNTLILKVIEVNVRHK